MTTTTMQIRNNSERANWQFRHKIYDRTNIKFAGSRNKRLNECAMHREVASTNRLETKNHIENLNICECVTVALSVRYSMPTDNRDERKNSATSNLRSHCGLIETFNFRHNRKTKRFNYAIMSSCLLGRTLVNKCTTK